MLLSKNVNIFKSFGWALILFAAMIGVQALAQKPTAKDGESPTAVVEKVTRDMMSIIRTGQKALKENPEAYFNDIRKVLEPVVSFKFIAKNVMANYWNTASADQKQAFTETFTQSMVETFGKGMANYTDLKIVTLPSEGDAESQKRVEVLQEVQGGEKVVRVSYTLAKHPSEGWKLINVVLNGVNLGQTFRDQFAQAAKQQKNDLDKVIAEWGKSS